MKGNSMGRFRIVFLTLFLCWMAVIFLFSARTADESSEDSYRVGMAVGTILYPDFDNWEETAQMDFAKAADYPVRKTAHALEYTVMGVLCTLTLLSWLGIRNRYFLMAWLISVFYASTDEFHQLFVPGRSGRLTDVLIDSAGALFGVMAVWIVGTIFRRWRGGAPTAQRERTGGEGR